MVRSKGVHRWPQRMQASRVTHVLALAARNKSGPCKTAAEPQPMLILWADCGIPGQSQRQMLGDTLSVWKCLVLPGVGATAVFLAPKMALMVEDLPTLG